MDALDRELERFRQENGGTFGNGFGTDDSNTGGKVDIKTILVQGENVLWEGDGKAPKDLKDTVLAMLLLIIWHIVLVLWMIFFFLEYGIIAVFVGVFVIIIGIVYFSRKTPPHYVITNMRVISLVYNNFNTIMLSEITSMRIEHQSDNTANIYFTTENPLPLHNEHELYTTGGMISRIQDGDTVYNILEKAVYDSQKTV